MNEDLLLQALELEDQALPDAEPAQADHPATIEPATQEQPQKSLLQRAGDVWKSVGGGIAKAGMETKDFVFGEPEEGDKWQIRKDLERRSKELNSDSAVNAAASGVAQIVTGLIGVGKVMGPVKALQTMRQSGAAGLAAFEIGKAATASAIVLDPHEERLSNLIEEVPALRNPVTDYLAADPNDSAAEGRFKNALESIGLDFALLGAAKVIKLLRAGKQKEALKEIEQLEAGKPSAVDEANARIVEAPDATAARTVTSEAGEAIVPPTSKKPPLSPLVSKRRMKPPTTPPIFPTTTCGRSSRDHPTSPRPSKHTAPRRRQRKLDRFSPVPAPSLGRSAGERRRFYHS